MSTDCDHESREVARRVRPEGVKIRSRNVSKMIPFPDNFNSKIGVTQCQVLVMKSDIFLIK